MINLSFYYSKYCRFCYCGQKKLFYHIFHLHLVSHSIERQYKNCYFFFWMFQNNTYINSCYMTTFSHSISTFLIIQLKKTLLYYVNQFQSYLAFEQDDPDTIFRELFFLQKSLIPQSKISSFPF